MNFSQINGHDSIKKRLIDGVAAGRVSHAQLFVGDSSSRALAMAIAYARYVLCAAPTLNGACEQCPSCYRTSKLEHPDLHFIFPVNKSKKARSTGRSDEKPISDHFIHLWREFILSNGGVFNEGEWYEYIDIENQQGDIKKEEADELLRKMSFKSFEGGYKVTIIYLVERMGAAPSNTLLKLIEEPPPKTLFLFVSENEDLILPTILSRLQVISLPSLERLNRVGTHDEQCFELFVELMRKAYGAKYLELFDWVESIAAIGREGHKAFCERSITLLRHCYLTSIGKGDLVVSEPLSADFVAKFAPFVNHLTIEPLVAEFELLLRQIRQNGNARIVFTHFALCVSKIMVNGKRALAAGQ